MGVRVEYLDTDVVCSCVAVLLDAFHDGLRVAPGDECVNQAVAAAVGEVGIREAVPAQVGGVVRQRQVATQMLSSNLTRPDWIGLDDRRLFGDQEFSGAEQATCV